MRTRSNSFATFTAALRRLLLTLILLAGLGWVGTQAWRYWQTRDHFTPGTTIAGLDVSGLTADEAQTLLEKRYYSPVYARYHDEVVELNPADAGFVMDVEGMLAEAISAQEETEQWKRFGAHLLRRPLDPVRVRLRASHDPAAVRNLVRIVANLLDQPAAQPQLLTDTGFIEAGRPGYACDIDASAMRVDEALYEPHDREVAFVIQAQPAPELNLSFLEAHLQSKLDAFDGIGVTYVYDLQTGEEIAINADAAVSGLSIVKIAIMLEVFRAVDGPLNADQQKLLNQTAVFSGNFSANLLLDIVAGQDNAYLGVDILTESMRRLGLENTFIATPYEERPRPGKQTYVTPANARTDLNLDPDPAMQTTAAEIGQLLAMIYYCSQGGGTLIAAYPEQLTPEECQLLLDTLVLNTEGNLIRFGVPEEVPVAHKHGWAYNTHGDAGIVFSPGGDYVIVQYLYQDSDWLNAAVSFPLLRELSRSVYNYFNSDAPYVDHKRAQKAAGKYVTELIAQQIEAGTLPAFEATPAPPDTDSE